MLGVVEFAPTDEPPHVSTELMLQAPLIVPTAQVVGHAPALKLLKSSVVVPEVPAANEP
jgi:hypothetical protein